jgi:hypothetical protein
MAMKDREDTLKVTTRTSKLNVYNDHINSPLDFFDALPLHIQQNSKLLTEFANMILGNFELPVGCKMKYYRDKWQVHERALKIHSQPEYRAMRPDKMIEHDLLKPFRKEYYESGYSDRRLIEWIRELRLFSPKLS